MKKVEILRAWLEEKLECADFVDVDVLKLFVHHTLIEAVKEQVGSPLLCGVPVDTDDALTEDEAKLVSETEGVTVTVHEDFVLGELV